MSLEQPKLRLGIMCTGPHLSLWAKECVSNMLATGHVTLALIILDSPLNYSGRSAIQKIRDIGFSKALFNIYLKTLYRPASTRSEPIGEWYHSTPRLECVVHKKGRWSQYFSAEDLAAIRAYDLDIVLRFGFNIIRGEILQVPRYGVWSFHHDDELKYRGGPPCLWEIYHKDPATGSILQRLNDSLDAGIILKKGFLRTKDFSYRRNVDAAYFESAKWGAWVVRDIVQNNAPYLQDAPTITKAPIYRSPTNGQFLRLQGIMGANFIRTAWNRLFVRQMWNVALVKGDIRDFPYNLKGAQISFLEHRNKATFNADCFGFRKDGRIYVYIEELDYSDGGIGKIRVVTMDESGRETNRQEVKGLATAKHLSYPFIYEEAGTYYMIPESSQDKAVNLYRMKSLPDEWEPVATLLQGEAYVDTTLLRHDGRYWLFYAINEAPYDGDVHLHIAWSDKLEGPYTKHAANPVKISARAARPAGTFYKDAAGNLIRPSQNFTRSYGGSMVLNKVVTLNEHTYAEEEVQQVLPFDKYYKDGLHNLARIDDEYFVVDMKRHIFKPGGK